MLLKRLMRLQRYASYKQNGRGEELNDLALKLVEHCIRATRAEWIESLEVPV
jgi:hypothetical protein